MALGHERLDVYRLAIHHLPPILDRAILRKILDAHRNPKHRAILALAYGSGLRVSEICHLRPCHIESAPDRMMVRVEQGKGRKDRLHVLPRGFQKVRAFGWLSPKRKRIVLAAIRAQLRAKEPPPAPTDASPAERILRLTGVDVWLCPD